MPSLRNIILGLIAAVALAVPAFAAPVNSGHVEVELVAQGQAAPGGQAYVALRQKIAPGWHTYWRNPGDSGEATRLVWKDLPKGWSAGEFVWATPRPLPYAILMNYGYEGEVLLPLALSVPASARPGQTVRLSAEAAMLVCSDVCVPEQASLTLDLAIAAQPASDPKWAEPIARALAAAPKPAGLAAAFTIGEPLRLSVTGPPLKGGDFPEAYFFPYDGKLIDHAKPQSIERGPEGLTLGLPAGYAFKTGEPPREVAGVLSLGGAAYEITAKADAPLAGAAGLGPPTKLAAGGASPPPMSILQAVLFAFVGGLILNLMPCVFPILSMKAAALAGHAHEARAARVQGLAFLAGVVATFLALATALIAAKAAGAAVGWGFQLQSPPVIAALCLLMLLVALNLSGLFEIGLSAQGAGTGLASKSGLAGAFFTGALAVVVAAPCTAPFMAVALGYALAQPALIALAVFLALGMGFALPFTALAFAPGLLRRLPRPGPWMGVFKTVLAFPMYGAAAWLAWVFTIQAGVQGLALLFAAALMAAFGAWLFGEGQRRFDSRGRMVLMACLPIALVAAALLVSPAAKSRAGETGQTDAEAAIRYEPYSPERLAALRAEGRPVFVNFTAAWCVTCQVNEKVALSRASTAKAFSDTNTAYLKADWTNRDAVILKALAEHGRSGVPLYLVYGADGSAPKILPQLLTPGVVRAALAEAAAE